MNIKNLEFITNQILQSLDQLREKGYTEGLIDLVYESSNEDEKLEAILAQQAHADSDDDVCYCEFELYFKDNPKVVLLTVGWTPLDEGDAISTRGRKAPPRHVFYTTSGKIYIDRKNLNKVYFSVNPENIEEGFKNLIIVPNKPDFDEICFQVGMYLYREDVFKDKGLLYGLFQKIMKRIGVNTELQVEKGKKGFFEGANDTDIFQRVIERFEIPNRAESFRIYLRMLIKDMKRLFKTEVETQERFNIPRQTRYTWLRRKKIKLPRINGRYQYDQIDVNQLAWLKMKREERKKWEEESQVLASYLSEKESISIESAKRKLRRWKKKDLTFEEMARKIKALKP